MSATNPNTKTDPTSSTKNDSTVHFYPEKEEKFNILSHGLGFLLSIVGTYFLIQKAQLYENKLHSLSFIIYGFSLIILYGASTLYHSAQKPDRRRFFNIVDHAAIYILIAGSYTPFTTITLEGSTGRILFGTIWGCALVGIVAKLFFTGKYDRLSTIMYVLMGWIAIFAIKPLIDNLHPTGLIYVGMGGALYTIGAVFYSLKSLSYGHAIFHIFVLGGSLCHYLAIYLYV